MKNISFLKIRHSLISTLILTFLLFHSLSVAQTSKEEKTLQKQLKQGYKQVYTVPAPDIPKSEITESELNSTVSIAKDILSSAGFKPLSNPDLMRRSMLSLEELSIIHLTPDIYTSIFSINVIKK